ncbi:uncharacterized protein LOC120355238 isoform X2 [Nilaparvata lugens]|uniref:uncharacterized protein LOC120355238 isoform X2 n=1 Tax=Nilaparvata lugens TaxID=108931 RepID=UPI00193D28F2|nr:uncharacterized protein LOC120355238 isoform X2 [Nilaparvata lugens]XP_039299518.1 uncharacterized protein LOC120355238 isoform X2 [Nilaparvata lugens]
MNWQISTASLGGRREISKIWQFAKFIVFDTVKHHVASVTEKEVDSIIIACWLVQAKGRMSRMEKKTGGNEPSIRVEDKEGEI